MYALFTIDPLNAELNPICHLLALLGAHHILHVSRIRVKEQILLQCKTRIISELALMQLIIRTHYEGKGVRDKEM